jgi:hypothetical protein
MCHDNDLDEDDWDEDDLDWDDEWDQTQEEQPLPSQIGLIGIVFRHDNHEQPWLVQDNRKALDNKFPCSTKADVLDKIAEILDDMHLPPSKLDRDTDPVEITVAVSLQASLCDLDTVVNILDLRQSVAKAVENAVRHHEQVGFDHTLADIVSLGLVDVRPLNAE